MKLLLFLTLLLSLSACSSQIQQNMSKKEYKTSFKDVWNLIKSDPYKKLPQREVSYFKLSKGEGIEHSSWRTLNDQSDILAPFKKLAHPNGICFRGVWKIDETNDYDGYFKKGSEALVIARASTAMSNTKSGATRAFGFAAKLFPTMDETLQNREPSANVFLIEDLGGTDAKHFLDVSLTNEPSVSFTLEAVLNTAYGLKVAHSFAQADKNPAIRQLYEVSSLAESKEKKVNTPKWLKIVSSSQKRVDAVDFREELTIEKNKKLVFDIFVANLKSNMKKNWEKIGTITLNESVVSEACDARLHFHHPKWRNDLKF